MRRILILTFLLAGCTEDPPPQGLTPQQPFQAQFADVMAKRLSECAKVPKESVGTMYTLHTLARFNAEKAIDDERVVFSRDAAETCLEQLDKSPCAALAFDLDVIAPACTRVYDGKGLAGAKCHHAIECAADLFCAMPNGACPGKCAAHVAAGEVCEDDNACEKGATCVCANANCASRVCRPPAKIGSSCGTVDVPGCGDDAYCAPRGVPKPHTCQRRVKEGAPCVTSDACVKPLHCVGFSSAKKPGTCKNAKALGDACSPGANECAASAACIGEKKKAVCTAWAGPGGTCGVFDGEPAGCMGGYCDDGTCKPYKRPGEGCDYKGAMDACGPGRCDSFTHACVYPCAER